MPVCKYLDLSISHITYEDAETLEEWRSGPRVVPHEFGFFVHVPRACGNRSQLDPEQLKEIVEGGLSPALVVVLEHARKKDCEWVNLDRDAVEENGLPVFEW